MREETRKYSIILTLWTLLSIWLWWCYGVSQVAQAVGENGVEVRAKIIERHYAKGWTTNVEYYYDRKKYTYYIGKPEFIPQVGDSLIIKILPNEPDKFILVKERFFSISHKP